MAMGLDRGIALCMARRRWRRSFDRAAFLFSFRSNPFLSGTAATNVRGLFRCGIGDFRGSAFAARRRLSKIGE
jgi:hypothetical protein